MERKNKKNEPKPTDKPAEGTRHKKYSKGMRLNVRPLVGPDVPDAHKRRITTQRIAKVFRGFVLSVERERGKEMSFIDLLPYAGQVVDQFIKDHKLKVVIPDTPELGTAKAEKKSEK